MDGRSGLRGSAGRTLFAGCLCLALAQGALGAGRVTRTVEPTEGGCWVSLTWDFSGKVESDLIVEERLAPGWTVDGETVPFGSLDASWFAGNVARFAVKPTLLGEQGTIRFCVRCGDAAAGSVNGSWQMYEDGVLSKGTVSGSSTLECADKAGVAVAEGTGAAETTGTTKETSVSIASFKVDGASGIELSYVGLKEAGELVVEGCVGLGKAWREVGRFAVSAGDGTVRLSREEIGACCFFRMKLLTTEK